MDTNAQAKGAVNMSATPGSTDEQGIAIPGTSLPGVSTCHLTLETCLNSTVFVEHYSLVASYLISLHAKT